MNALDILYSLVLVLHFLGLASLVGGWLVQLRTPGERQIHPAMLHGVLTMVVTGVIMMGLAESIDSLERDIDSAKMGVKLLVAVVIAVLAWTNRRRQSVPDGLYILVGALAITNVLIAVLWT